MADKLSKKQRSLLMSKIKSKDTRFEQDFVAALKKKIRRKIETQARDVRGTPDIIFRREKICVFLDSDFWHGWHYYLWGEKLKNDFWRNKIERNRRRDRAATRYLRKNGWIVIRVWEHGIKQGSKDVVTKISCQLNALKT